MLFGELTVHGFATALNDEHLEGGKCNVLYDLGMGIYLSSHGTLFEHPFDLVIIYRFDDPGLGKAALQSFFQYPGIRKVVGYIYIYGRSIFRSELC